MFVFSYFLLRGCNGVASCCNAFVGLELFFPINPVFHSYSFHFNMHTIQSNPIQFDLDINNHNST